MFCIHVFFDYIYCRPIFSTQLRINITTFPFLCVSMLIHVGTEIHMFMFNLIKVSLSVFIYTHVVNIQR